MIPNLQLQTAEELALFRNSLGRVEPPKGSYSAAYATASNLPTSLRRMYAKGTASYRTWNAFHEEMTGNYTVCAPFGIAIKGARQCRKPAMCPSCGARQLLRVIETFKGASITEVAAVKFIASEISTAMAHQTVTMARSIAKKAQAAGYAVLPRVYPAKDKGLKLGVLLFIGDGDLSALYEKSVAGLYSISPRVYSADEMYGVPQEGKYPKALIEKIPVEVYRAYSKFRGIRATIVARKAIYDNKGNNSSRRSALSLADVAFASGDSGGCVPQSEGCSRILPTEEAIAMSGR